MEEHTIIIDSHLSESRPATAEIQEIAGKIRPQLEEKSNEKYEKFEAVVYKLQVLIDGKNYFIKITFMDVGSGCYFHIKVFSDISNENDLELRGYETNKTKNDELTYFIFILSSKEATHQNDVQRLVRARPAPQDIQEIADKMSQCASGKSVMSN
ncbi:stefin-2-like [Apodemus sylvaticus]|uniref:stefin-2-like n=1 Tax=Apodemus sylvaticus TaxID=10129 RepID=UPI002242E66B|nr:stefin-2-like [Apodemus sylvaticus]